MTQCIETERIGRFFLISCAKAQNCVKHSPDSLPVRGCGNTIFFTVDFVQFFPNCTGINGNEIIALESTVMEVIAIQITAHVQVLSFSSDNE